MVRISEIQDLKNKKVRRSYWPLTAYITYDGRAQQWLDQENKILKYDPESNQGTDCDQMWEEWDESMVPPPSPPHPVEVVTIKLEKHDNADTLSVVQVKGWTCVVKTEIFKNESLAVYVPPDSVVPDTVRFRDGLGIAPDKPYRAGDFKIRCIKLRQVFSQGLLLPLTPDEKEKWKEGDNVCEALGITKYEPPERYHGHPGCGKGLGGDCLPEPPEFHHYTKIQRINNYPDVIAEGERVIVSEKIHGTNWRAGLIGGEFFVGSHHTTKKESPTSSYWKMALAHNVKEKLATVQTALFESGSCGPVPPNIIFFGEVFGDGIQHLKYGLTDGTINLRLFDISVNGRYLDYDEFLKYVDVAGLPVVPYLYDGPFHMSKVKELSNGKDFTVSHYREGVVVRLKTERWHMKIGRVILKAISQDYELDKNRTDFH